MNIFRDLIDQQIALRVINLLCELESKIIAQYDFKYDSFVCCRHASLGAGTLIYVELLSCLWKVSVLPNWNVSYHWWLRDTILCGVVELFVQCLEYEVTQNLWLHCSRCKNMPTYKLSGDLENMVSIHKCFPSLVLWLFWMNFKWIMQMSEKDY